MFVPDETLLVATGCDWQSGPILLPSILGSSSSTSTNIPVPTPSSCQPLVQILQCISIPNKENR